MAYENMTYEVILNRMLNRVSEKYPTLDTREGSVIFNALAPAAVELTTMYIELDNVLRESFVSTASREYLLKACDQMGIDITIFNASAGVHRGEFNVEIPIGSRWNCDLYNFVATEYVGVEENAYVYKLECETIGTDPNNVTGDLTAISDIPSGLSSAKVTNCLVEGENETPDEDIRSYYVNYITNSATDGNIAQYKLWCENYDGIGKYKIVPEWSGLKSRILIVILSSSNQLASQELIDEFQNYLDPGSSGLGDGVAPIGAVVTVDTGEEWPIDVAATVKFKDGYSDTSAIDSAIRDYFSRITFEKDTISYMSLGAAILDVEGVDSISNLTINGDPEDWPLMEFEVPILRTTNWTVS